MAPQSNYDVAARACEKQEARARDIARIAYGKISAAELQDQNGFFSVLDASRSRLVNPRVRVQILLDVAGPVQTFAFAKASR